MYECSFDIIRSVERKKNKDSEEYSKKVTMLSIAYHNLGVEEDYCSNLENAKQAYYKAYEMIERVNGPNDPLVKKFKQAYTDAKTVTPDPLCLRSFTAQKCIQSNFKNRGPTFKQIYGGANTAKPKSNNFRIGMTRREASSSSKLKTSKVSSPTSKILLQLEPYRHAETSRDEPQQVPAYATQTSNHFGSNTVRAQQPNQQRSGQMRQQKQQPARPASRQAPSNIKFYSSAGFDAEGTDGRPKTANPKARIQTLQTNPREQNATVNNFMSSDEPEQSVEGYLTLHHHIITSWARDDTKRFNEEILEIEKIVGIDDQEASDSREHHRFASFLSPHSQTCLPLAKGHCQRTFVVIELTSCISCSPSTTGK